MYVFVCVCPDIEFKQGDKEHVVEVEVLFDGVREMREAFTLHLKPDENMVAETQVRNVFISIHHTTHITPNPGWWKSIEMENFLIWPIFIQVSPTETRDLFYMGCSGPRQQ